MHMLWTPVIGMVSVAGCFACGTLAARVQFRLLGIAFFAMSNARRRNGAKLVLDT
jgi:hypothetical protein